MAKNKAQGRVAASASKTASNQKRSQLMTGGLTVAALVLVAAAIVVGVKFGGSGSAVGGNCPLVAITVPVRQNDRIGHQIPAIVQIVINKRLNHRLID